MRTHTTLTLRNLILNDMDPAKHQMNQQDINVWIETFPLITADMFQTMKLFTSFLFEKRIVRRQIGQVQRECGALLDAIDKQPKLRKEMLPLQKALIACIDEILEHMESLYAEYMDDDMRLPQLHVRREAAQVQASMDLLSERFCGQNVSVELQASAFHCMKDAARLKRISYGQMRYVQRLQAVLIELMGTSCNDPDRAVCELLYHELYNFSGFTDFYKSWIRKQADTDRPEQYRILLERYKWTFRKAPYKKKAIHYDTQGVRCHEIMYNFVLAELARCAPKVEKVIYVTPEPPRPQQPPAEKPYKIKTILSVESLAYLIKLMVEAKVIEAGVKTELFAFIASIFETPGTAENGISAGSFSTKYKNVVQATAATVRAKLARMILIIDEEFG